MKTKFPDSELEFELQELYIESKNWLQDLSFLGDEIRFFNNMLVKYLNADASVELNAKKNELKLRIAGLKNLADDLKKEVNDFVSYLEPFINDLNKDIPMELLAGFNELDQKVKASLGSVKSLKLELFSYAETVIK